MTVPPSRKEEGSKIKSPMFDTMRQYNVLVPGARVELAWISPNDFESFASTISPAGQRGEDYYRGYLSFFKTKSEFDKCFSRA